MRFPWYIHASVVGIACASYYIGYSVRSTELTPQNARCDVTFEMDGWSPMMRLEKKVGLEMIHQTHTSLDCTADVGEHFVTFTADQIFIKRYGKVPKLKHK